MTHSVIDAAITAASRSIVARSPSPEFERRLRQRLDGRERRRWPLVAVPVAATLVAAVVSSLPSFNPALPHAAPAPRAVAVAAPAPRLPDASAMSVLPLPLLSTDATETRSLGPAAAPVSAAEAAWAADAVQALTEPAALAVALTQPDAMFIPLLEVRELAAAPLSIPPIGAMRAPRTP